MDDNTISVCQMLTFLDAKVGGDDVLGYVCYPHGTGPKVIFYHQKDLLEMVGCDDHPAVQFLDNEKHKNKTLYGVNNLVTLKTFGMRDIPKLLANAPPTPATLVILKNVQNAAHLGLRNTQYLRDQWTVPRKVRVPFVPGVFTRSSISAVEDIEDALMLHKIPIRRSFHSDRDIVEKQKLYEKLPQVLIDFLNANIDVVTRNDRLYVDVDDLQRALRLYWRDDANSEIPQESRIECGKDSNRVFDRRDIAKGHLLQAFLQEHPWARWDRTTKLYDTRGLHNAVDNRSQQAALAVDIVLPEKVSWFSFARAMFDKNRPETTRVNMRSVLMRCYNKDQFAGLEFMRAKVGDVRFREYYLKTQSDVTKWDPDNGTFALGGAMTVLANLSDPDRWIPNLEKELVEKGLIPRNERYNAQSRVTFQDIDEHWAPLLYKKGPGETIMKMLEKHIFEAAKPLLDQQFEPMPPAPDVPQREIATNHSAMGWFTQMPASALVSQLLNVQNIDANSEVVLNAVTTMVSDGERTKQSQLNLDAERERTRQLELQLELVNMKRKQSIEPSRKRVKLTTENTTKTLRWCQSKPEFREWSTRAQIFKLFVDGGQAKKICPSDRYNAGTTSILNWLVAQLETLATDGALDREKKGKPYMYRLATSQKAEDDEEGTEDEEEEKEDGEF